MDQVICRHGVPCERELLSDHGANLLSTVIQDVCKLTGMAKVNTTVYHPQTDGLVENFTRTLRSMLAKHSREFGPEWDVYLQQLLFAYRTKPRDSTGESPFFGLWQGCETAYGVFWIQFLLHLVDSEDYQVELSRGLPTAWEVARSKIGKAQIPISDLASRTAFSGASTRKSSTTVRPNQCCTGKERG